MTLIKSESRNAALTGTVKNILQCWQFFIVLGAKSRIRKCKRPKKVVIILNK